MTTTTAKKNHIPIIARPANADDIENLIKLNRLFSDSLVQVPEDVWAKIVASQECVVAQQQQQGTEEESGELLGYISRRTLTADAELNSYYLPVLAKLKAEDAELYRDGAVAYGGQIAIAPRAQGTNVQVELFVAAAFQAWKVHGHRFSLQSIHRDNFKSVAMALKRDGQKVVDEAEEHIFTLTPDMSQIVAAVEAKMKMKSGRNEE